MKKITLATIKSFIHKNKDNLHISNKSNFDGMIDCVSDCNDKSFRKAEISDKTHKNELGVKGVWFVFQSRDYFNEYIDSSFQGFEVSNSCGRFILAIRKAA